MTELQVTLAGAVSFRRGTLVVADRAFSARQLQLVTAVLVMERQAAVPVSMLADALWAHDPPEQWRVAISGLVSTVRKRLGDVGVDPEAIRGEAGRYVVEVPDLRVDLEDAADDLGSASDAFARGEWIAARDRANDARTILSRPVLPGVTSSWLDALRDRIGHQHLDTLVVLGRARVELGSPGPARRVLREAVEMDPVREDAWRALMSAEVTAGNSAGALRAYEECRQHLAEMLGVDPSPATRDLHHEILTAGPIGASPAAAPTGDPAGDAIRGPAREANHPTVVGGRAPYVGLRAFGRDDAGLFFGRTAEVQAVIEKLSVRGVVAVVGPSGVGKSSLVRAGLLPALSRGAIANSDTWPTIVMTPGSEPVKTLATELGMLFDRMTPATATRLLHGGEEGLHDAVGQVLDASDTRLLVVVDQFEEISTLADAATAARFVSLLLGASGRLDGRVAIVVTLRADFYDRVATIAGFDEVLSRSQYVVPAIDGEQLEAVITGPARQADVMLEPGLLGQLLTEVAAEPGALPLLQHLLHELWLRRVDRVMTRHVYDELGGVAGALANRADAVFTALDADDQLVARRVLLRALQPDDEAGATRRPVHERELVAPGVDSAQVDRVVGRLVDARLLAADRDPDSGERVVEVAHEALIDNWPRLRGWVDEVRGHLLEHRRLTTAAREWEQEARHGDWLLQGRPLEDAEALTAAIGDGEVDLHLSIAEQDLVAASLATRQQQRAKEAERRAQEETLERRSRVRLRALVAVVTVAALVAGTLWVAADRRADITAVNELVAESAAVVESDPDLGLLIALAAHDRWQAGPAMPSHGVEAALHAGIEEQRLVAHFPDAGKVLDVTADGDLFVATRSESRSGPDLLLDLHDTTTGAIVRTFAIDGDDEPSAAFSPDGRVLVAGAGAGDLQQWDVASGDEIGRFSGPTSDATNVHVSGFDPDGDLLVGRQFAGSDEEDPGSVLVWDATSRELVRQLPRLPAEEGDPAWFGPAGAVFSPDGARLVVVPGLAPATAQVLDVATWEELYRVPAADGQIVTAAAWSPDGRWLALGGHQLRIVDAATGDLHRDLTHPDGFTGQNGLAWNDESDRLYVGTGSIQVWEPLEVQPEPMLLRGGFMGRHNHVFLLPGGDRLLTGARNSEGVRVWDVSPAAGSEVAGSPTHGDPTLAFSPDGDRLAVDRAEREVGMWDTATWTETDRIDVHDGDLHSMAWSPNGDVIVTGGGWDTVAWEPESGSLLWRFDHAGDPDLWAEWAPVGFHPDGDHVAVGATSEAPGYRVQVRNRAGEIVARLHNDVGADVEQVAFNPDGQHLAVARWGGRLPLAPRDFAVDIWDWEAQELVQSLDTEAFGMAWSPDGDRLVTADLRGTPQVWDLDAGEVVLRLVGHDVANNDVVWSPDGTRIHTNGEDGTVRTWDAASGEELQQFDFGMEGRIALALSPDGRWLAAAHNLRGMRVYAMDLDDLVAIARTRVTRDLTPAECRTHLGGSCPPTVLGG